MRRLLQHKASIILRVVILLLAHAFTYASQLDKWYWRKSLPPPNLLTGFASGNRSIAGWAMVSGNIFTL